MVNMIDQKVEGTPRPYVEFVEMVILKPVLDPNGQFVKYYKELEKTTFLTTTYPS